MYSPATDAPAFVARGNQAWLDEGREVRPGVEFHLWIQGAEEGMATDVIPMGVRDQDRRHLS